MSKKAKKVALVLAVGIAIVGLGIWVTFFAPEASSDGLALETAETASGEVSRETADVAAPESAPEENLVVHIGGAVRNGDLLLELPKGSRIADAVAAAGGICDDADLKSVNLAEVLTDGQKIYIPKEGETVVSPPTGIGSNGLVNINTADAAALDTLSGVGPALAKSIVDYRNAHGRFSSVEELKNVSGIGDKMLERIRDAITVG